MPIVSSSIGLVLPFRRPEAVQVDRDVPVSSSMGLDLPFQAAVMRFSPGSSSIGPDPPFRTSVLTLDQSIDGLVSSSIGLDLPFWRPRTRRRRLPVYSVEFNRPRSAFLDAAEVQTLDSWHQCRVLQAPDLLFNQGLV